MTRLLDVAEKVHISKAPPTGRWHHLKPPFCLQTYVWRLPSLAVNWKSSLDSWLLFDVFSATLYRYYLSIMIYCGSPAWELSLFNRQFRFVVVRTTYYCQSVSAFRLQQCPQIRFGLKFRFTIPKHAPLEVVCLEKLLLGNDNTRFLPLSGTSLSLACFVWMTEDSRIGLIFFSIFRSSDRDFLRHLFNSHIILEVNQLACQAIRWIHSLHLRITSRS